MVLRVDRERVAIGLRRAREIADELLRRAEVVVVLRRALVARDSASKRLECVGMRACTREHDADCVERERTLRIEPERALRGLERLARPVQRNQAPATLRVIFGLVRVARERKIDDLERLAEVAVLG